MLFPVTESSRAKGVASALDIVVVPALGLTRPSEWVEPSAASVPPRSSWLQKLVTDIFPGADVLEYVYRDSEVGSLAQRLLGESVILLEALSNHCEKTTPSKVPLIFISHGTGGFVMKNALCICRQQPFQYRSVIDVISGAIFLGAPHFLKEKQEAKETLDLLLKCQRKGIGRSLSSDNDVESLLDVCKSFELLNLKVPIVSAFESKPTSTQHKLFSKFRGKGRNHVIVPRSLGVLRASTETQIDSETDHFDICKVSVGGKVYQASVELIQDVMEYAPNRIAEANRPYTTPLGLRDDTLRSPSSAGHTRVEEQLSLSVPISSPLGGATGGSTTGSFEIIPAETAMEVTSRDPILPCFSLGTRQRMDTDVFLGRKDIMRNIDEHLLPPTGPPDSSTPNPGDSSPVSETGEEQLRSFAICGLGGMGKTELAVEYAYSRRDKFDAIFWLGADDAKILASNFAQIAQRLGLEDDSSDLAASRDVAMGWLSNPLRTTSEPETPENFVDWLIIFDNADNLEVLPDNWPKFGRGSVLVTSRDPFARHNLYMEKGMNLPPLSTLESEKLMQRLTHMRADASQKVALSIIAKNLDGLPFAINQTSGVLRRLRLSYTGFLKYYDDEGIKKLFRKQNDPTGSSSLATLWALDQLSTETKALLQVICLLDPDDIPEDLLIDKSGQVKFVGYPRSRGDYYGARTELLSSSLITQNAQQEKLSLHRLIQETVKDMMNREEFIMAFQAATSLTISSWAFQSMKEHHSVARFIQCEIIFSSVQRLKNGLEPLIQKYVDYPLDIGLARLFNDTGWYMFERGLPEETKIFCDLALMIGERLKAELGEVAIRSIRESHSFMGMALVETNEHSLSMVHKKKWLSMLEERKSESESSVEDYELGYAYNEIGVAYGNEGMLDEAAAAFHRSIELFQGLPDYEDTMLGWPEPNLGFIYWMQGKLEEAEEALVEILDIHAAAWGVDDTRSFKTGKILYGMGNVLEAQGRFDESANFHRRCFDQFTKVLGMKHHRVGDICHKMAGHYMRQRLYKDADGYLNSALKIFNTRSYLSRELSRTTFRKGKLFHLMGMRTEGDQLLTEAYNIRKMVVPQDSRPVWELDESDFDTLVAFWSR